MIWFTADTHFGHGNIIKYTKRPFNSPEEMDKEMIKRFNERIRPGDSLYHLGDVAWSSYNMDNFFGNLNTKEIHLIYGNHDKPKVVRHQNIRSYSDIKTLSYNDEYIVMCHYPMRTWRHRGHGAFHLYGHCHGTVPGLGRSMDVGVDTNNFYPYSFEEIKAKLKPIPFNVKD